MLIFLTRHILKQKTPFFISILVILFFCSPINAYVLKGPHILHLMIQKMRASKYLIIHQTLSIYGDDIEEPASILNETIYYKYPEHFRSRIQSDQTQKIYVSASDRSITIFNGRISSSSDAGLDHYKDILLFTDRILLEKRLALLGADPSVSCLGRFQGKIAFVIGATHPDEPVSQLWVDKESFQPIRFIIQQSVNGEPGESLEFRYRKWSAIGKSRYPMLIEAYSGERLLRLMQVNKVEENPVLDETLFNIDQLEAKYPPMVPEMIDVEEPDDLKDVQESIEDFKKRFE